MSSVWELHLVLFCFVLFSLDLRVCTVNIIPSCALLPPVSTIAALMLKCDPLHVLFPQGPGWDLYMFS